MCNQSVLKPVLTSWPPNFTKIFKQITGAEQSPLMLQMLHHYPRPKETQKETQK